MKIIVDLDGTLTVDDKNKEYPDKLPDEAMIETLREYRSNGFEITIFTARNMRSLNGDIEMIKQKTLPIIIEWLNYHNVPYDDIIVGKPWCGDDGFYIDDRAIRPSEFKDLSYYEIMELMNGK